MQFYIVRIFAFMAYTVFLSHPLSVILQNVVPSVLCVHIYYANIFLFFETESILILLKSALLTNRLVFDLK